MRALLISLDPGIELRHTVVGYKQRRTYIQGDESIATRSHSLTTIVRCSTLFLCYTTAKAQIHRYSNVGLQQYRHTSTILESGA